MTPMHIVISDLHLGAPNCQVLALNRLLDTLPTRAACLVLAGDALEGTERRLTKHHWRLLSRLRKLSDRVRLVWVRGNHDHDADAIAHLVGAEFVDEFAFRSGGKTFLCVHGDRWDSFLAAYPLLGNVADWCYLKLQRLNRPLALRLKRRSKTIAQAVEQVRHGALAYAARRGADVVVCGHTHHAEGPHAEKGVTYWNVGCWTDHHAHYLAVEDGAATLCEVAAD